MYWALQGPTMPTPLQLICTDFDGTLHSDFTKPPVPYALQTKLAQLQAQGATWVINTGRTLDDLRLGIDHAEFDGARARSASRCATCGVAGAVRGCARCHSVLYCSRACQRTHWRSGGHSLPHPSQQS